MGAENVRHCAIDVSRQGTSVRLTLRGDADMDAVERLRVALADLHSGAVSDHAEEVVVDLVNLAFMNSTCLKIVLTWIGAVAALEPAARYRIRLISNGAIPWQRRSLRALVGFAPGLVTVEPA